MEEREKYLEDARKNSKTISSEINELSYLIVNSKESFDRYKEKSRNILDLFKSLKPILKEERQTLWDKFQQVSNEHRQRQEKEKTDRKYASNRKKDIVISTIREAKNYASGDIDSLRKAEELLKIANERMKPGWDDGFSLADSMFHMTDGKMNKEDSDHCWQYWNEVKDKINSRRKEIFASNHYSVNHDINSVSEIATYGDPFEALRNMKEIRANIFSLPMSRENKDSLLKSLNVWWEKANKRIQEKKIEKDRKQKEWEERKAEKERKQREWEQKQKEWEAKKLENERKQKEWLERKAERERKQREWLERKAEQERKQREWEERKAERERKQREWEVRREENERKHREWEERKLERERRQQEYEERKRNRGNNRNSGGGCYITTATCLTLGKPDDCHELTAIRQFRDEWLCRQKNGIVIISEYYQVAPKIVEAINQKENYQQIYKDIWENYLKNFFQLILLKQNRKAKAIYLKMVNDLKADYLVLNSFNKY